jgi:hypothetical protein
MSGIPEYTLTEMYFLSWKKMGYLASRTEFVGTDICKNHKTGTVARKSGRMAFLRLEEGKQVLSK